MAGPIKVYTVTIASAGTSTSAFTFPDGVTKAFLEIPSLTTSADFTLLASTDGTNYRRVMQDIVASSSVQINRFTIASGTTNAVVPIPLAAPYMKVEMSSAPVTAASFRIICHQN
jgi:hypothetical protein